MENNNYILYFLSSKRQTNISEQILMFEHIIHEQMVIIKM
ncbi:hypothetical protein pb186bvf_002702 [Paramecium bursaria]